MWAEGHSTGFGADPKGTLGAPKGAVPFGKRPSENTGILPGLSYFYWSFVCYCECKLKVKMREAFPILSLPVVGLYGLCYCSYQKQTHTLN